MLNNLRIDNLCQKFSSAKIDALLVVYPANVTYLCRYKITDAYLLVCPKETYLITDFRYRQEASENIHFPIKLMNGSVFKAITGLVKKLKIKQLGFESRHYCFYEYDRLRDCLSKKTKLLPAYELVEGLRAIKGPDEIEKIETAVKLTEDAFILLKEIIKPGITELQVAGEVERFIRLKGASCSAFDIIVASGARSAMPHAKTSAKIINDREPVLVDMGVEIEGYKSDLTRMYFIGKMAEEIKAANRVVFAAKQRAIAGINSGAPIKKIDEAAREYIAQFGWAKNFGHATGHGVGLDVHEDPPVNRKTNTRLSAGMVFTIEPAVYFPQKFGIRLEDMVLVTEKGAKILNGTLDNRM